MSKRHMVRYAAAATVAGLGSVSFAAPYAAQITSSGGTVNFVLSEDASEVIIVRDGVAAAPVAMTAGAQSFTLDGAANYQIIARKNSANGYLFVNNTIVPASTSTAIPGPRGVNTEIGDAVANAAVQQFYVPRDVAVNTNPATPELFGRVYVAEARGRTQATTPVAGRQTTQGIFVINADRTASSLMNPDGVTGLTGGVTFPAASTVDADMYRIQLDSAGNVYVSDYNDTGTPGVRVWDPNIATGNNVLVGTANAPNTVDITPSETQNHGSVAGFVVFGSTASGNLTLQTVDEDLLPTNLATYTYALGSTNTNNPAIPTGGTLRPTINTTIDLERLSDGRLFMTQNRSDGFESGLFGLDSTGTAVTYSSLVDATLLKIDGNASQGPTSTPARPEVQDVFRGVQGAAISPDEKWLGLATNNTGDAFLVPLFEGIPDIANRRLIDINGTTSTDLAFDAANNLWNVNRSAELLKVYSPGGISYTVYNSNGTFKTINGHAFDGSGSYDDTSKWAFGSVPGKDPIVLEDKAIVGALSTGNQTLSIDTDVNLANLTFSGGNYTVSGPAKIVMGGDGSFESYLEGRVVAESGTHTVNALIDVRKNFGVAAYTGATLKLTNVTYANAARTDPASTPTAPLPLIPNDGNLTIQKFGGGTVEMPAFKQALLVVRDGTLKFNSAASAGPTVVTSLHLAATTGTGSASETNPAKATIDLGLTGLIVTSGLTLADAKALVISGFNSGSYTGKGITSSDAAANNRYGVVATNGNELGLTSAPFNFMGVSITDLSTPLIRTALKGDSNVDGSVNFNDLLTLARNYNGTQTTWVTGDYDYNGLTNFNDLLGLARNYNASIVLGDLAALTSDGFAADFALAQSLVPEPTSLTLLGLGALAVRRRRA